MITAIVFALGVLAGMFGSEISRWLEADADNTSANASLMVRLMKKQTAELPNLNFADWLRLIWFLTQWIYWEWRGQLSAKIFGSNSKEN